MRCQVCNGETQYFLSKKFSVPKSFEVQYRKCGVCGVVFSATHQEMSESERDNLNHEYHSQYSGENNPNDRNWLARTHSQAEIICAAARTHLIDIKSEWLDYGAGSGKLSALIYDRCKKRIKKFDKYGEFYDVDYCKIDDVPKKIFGFTVSAAVFEHLNFRYEWDSINDTVSPEGVLGLHTLVCEEIPADPDWFYYLPVHSTFFTNKSMAMLHAQWGYACSTYDVKSRLWFWFRKSARDVAGLIRKGRSSGEVRQLLLEKGFLAYWK